VDGEEPVDDDMSLNLAWIGAKKHNLHIVRKTQSLSSPIAFR
jgi:hypothetical protein